MNQRYIVLIGMVVALLVIAASVELAKYKAGGVPSQRMDETRPKPDSAAFSPRYTNHSSSTHSALEVERQQALGR